jgi:hypothetical protein
MLTSDNFSGAFLSILLANLVLIALLGALILAVYRRRIRTLMRGGDSIAVSLPPERPGQNRLRFTTIASPHISQTRSATPDIPFAVLAIELFAGVCFATLAAMLWLRSSGTPILPLRLAAFTLTFILPVLVVMALVMGPDRRKQSFLLIGGFFVFIVFGATLVLRQPDDGLLVVWQILFYVIIFYGGSAFVPLLGLFNRSLRALWPILLVLVFLCTLGVLAQLALRSSLMEQMDHLYLSAAISIGLGWRTALVLAHLPGFFMGIALSWFVIARLAVWHQEGRLGDQALLHNAVWAAASLNLFLWLFVSIGPKTLLDTVKILAVSSLPLLIYIGITKTGYFFLHQKLRSIPGRPLLYLRVFGYSRRASRLADLLRARWRYRGSLRLIAARDLASRVITPVMLRAFLLRRLKGFFIETEANLESRMASLSNRRDPDGSFRTELLFCNGGSWRETVRRLMKDSHGVVMDLRSFNRQNRGCVFELQTLLDFVSVSRILLLVDSRPGPAQTDVAFLQEVMTEAWTHLAVTSPNHAIPDPVLRLIDAASGDAKAVAFIIRELEAL